MSSYQIRFLLRVLMVTVLLLGALAAPLVTQGGSTDLRTSNPVEHTRWTPDQAIVVAVNDIDVTADGYRLRHPHHEATFTPYGIEIEPRRGGPTWTWQLAEVRAGEAPLAGVTTGAVRPVNDQPSTVAYARGGLVEQYLARKDSLEQQFVILQPLELGGADLVIVGSVTCAGTFEETAEGWLWQTERGGVRLGQVRVNDARGAALSARMVVTAEATRIVVDGNALALASYPVTVDPEIGTNDFRISYMGHAYLPEDELDLAVAYNSTDNQYLVVWEGFYDTAMLVFEEVEVFGQLVDAETGAEIGGNIRLSNMGPDGDGRYAAFSPAAAYNSTNNAYLVVWAGDDDSGLLLDNEFEIYGQRVDAATGAEIGTNDFRLSSMGPDGDLDFIAWFPAVAYNSTNNEYLVVWEGEDNILPLVDDEVEIFGQRVNAATGAQIAPFDFRLSDMGPNGHIDYEAGYPEVVYNSTNNEYLVVWYGDDNTPPLVDDECEIYGQRVNAATGAEIGSDFRLSDVGPDGDPSYDAFSPALAYNSANNEYLVVWTGDDNTSPLVEGEYEIFGQRLNAATGAEIGNDFRLSDMGPDGNTNFRAFDPGVAFNSTDDEYLVVWRGEDNTGTLVEGETEIFGQRLDAATGSEVGNNDVRLSDMGFDGSPFYIARCTAVTYNSTDDEYLVVWYGLDTLSGKLTNLQGVFGQRVEGATGAETGANDFQLSDVGSDTLYDAYDPAITFNGTDNQYIAVWWGDHNFGTLVDDEFEIFDQRVDGATGMEVGQSLRLSHMGGDGNVNYGAQDVAVAYSSTENEYLVVWSAEDAAPLVDGEYEIFGQRINAATGEKVGADFRLSDMGPDGNASYDAYEPAVAYNPTNNEYMVVWRGDDDTGVLVDEEFEIYGERVDAATGAELTSDLRLSDMGLDGNPDYDAWEPAVVYNPNNQYLVVWRGDDNTGSLVDEEFEVYGQRLNAATGAPLGTNDFRLSDMGLDGNASYDAYEPAVAYNSVNNEYLVVWRGDDNIVPLVGDEYEIFGQRVDGATATENGTNDFRLSDMGPDGDVSYRATVPSVVYNSMDNEYLVIWSGDDNTAPLVDGEYEIFVQRLEASTGAEIGGNDFRLSDMGPDGDANYDARETALAYNSTNNEYLVVWSGDDNTFPLVDEEFEIFSQRFSSHYWLYLSIVARAP